MNTNDTLYAEPDIQVQEPERKHAAAVLVPKVLKKVVVRSLEKDSDHKELNLPPIIFIW